MRGVRALGAAARGEDKASEREGSGQAAPAPDRRGGQRLESHSVVSQGHKLPVVHVSLKLAAISSTRRLGLSCCEILTGQQAPLGSAPGAFSPQGARSCRWVTSTGDHQHLGGLAGVPLAEWLAAQAGRGGLRRKGLRPVLSEVGEGERRAAPWQPCWFAA